MNFTDFRAKPLIISLIYAPFIFFYVLATYIGTFLGDMPWIFGVALVVLAIPVAILGGRFRILYLVATVCNAFGTGFITAYHYVYFGISLSFGALTSPMIIAISYITLTAAFLYIFHRRKVWICLTSGLLTITALVLSVVFWVIDGSVFYSFSTFLSILAGTVIVLLSVVMAGDDENELLRDCAFASFGILILVGLVVMLLVAGDGCDCDASCCESCDCPSSDAKGKARTKK